MESFQLLKQLLDDSRQREIELKEKLKEREEEFDVLLQANKSFKEKNISLNNENIKLHELYTKTFLELEQCKEKIKKLSKENHDQAMTYVKLKEENERLQAQQNEEQPTRRPEQLAIRRNSSIEVSSLTTSIVAVYSPSSGQKQLTRSSSSTTTTPLKESDMRYLMNKLGYAANKWKQIGIQFGIPNSKLESIKNENNSDMDCLSETISYWLQSSQEDCTLQFVNEVLESPSVDRKDLINI